MKKININEMRLNNFKKYVLQKEYEKQNLSNSKKKRSNSTYITTKNNSFHIKNANWNLSKDIIEEKYVFETPIKRSIIKRPIMTPIEKVKHIFSEPKKKNEIDSEFELLSPMKIKFSINNLVNTILYNLYMKKSYKKLLIEKLNPFLEKKQKETNIKIDLRNTQKKGRFYIPIKNRNLRGKNEKREIGIQISSHFDDDNKMDISYEEKYLENNKTDNKIKYKINNDKYYSSYNKNKQNNQIKNYFPIKKEKNHKINTCKSAFNNKYELINKKLVKNFLDFSFRSKYPRYTKIKKLINNENKRVGKILNKLRYEQNNANEKLKLDLIKLDGYKAKKNKKNNNNSYNLFL